jgi:hypothetical protein
MMTEPQAEANSSLSHEESQTGYDYEPLDPVVSLCFSQSMLKDVACIKPSNRSFV